MPPSKVIGFICTQSEVERCCLSVSLNDLIKDENGKNIANIEQIVSCCCKDPFLSIFCYFSAVIISARLLFVPPCLFCSCCGSYKSELKLQIEHDSEIKEIILRRDELSTMTEFTIDCN